MIDWNNPKNQIFISVNNNVCRPSAHSNVFFTHQPHQRDCSLLMSSHRRWGGFLSWRVYKKQYITLAFMRIPGGGGYPLQPPLAPHDIITNPLMMSPQTSSHLHFSNIYFGGHLKVSARVKAGEFSKFLISRCSDKVTDFEVHYRLIVLITRWQILSFKSNLYVNTSWNKSQGIVVSFYHAIHAARLVQMSSKKRRDRVCFLLQRQGQRSRKNRLARIGLKP